MPTIQQPGAATTPRPTPAAQGGQADAALTSALEQAGLLAGGQNPTVVGKELVKNLLSRGFYGGMGALPSQVKKALSAFQSAKGLPVTGKLDAATLSALGQLGLLPGGAQAARRPGAADGFDKPVAKTQDRTDIDLGRGMTAGDQAAGKADTGAPPPSLGQQLRQGVEALLGRFGLGGGAGKAGEGAAGTQGGQAAADGQAHADAAPSGGQQATHASGSANAASTRGQAADGAHIPQTRSDALGDKVAHERGTRGDPAAEKGRAKKKGDKAGRIGDDDDDDEGARQQGRGEGGAGGEGDEGHEVDPGNATSGDDELAGERGHASRGDEEAEAGHYRIPSLAEQLEDALELVVREDEGAGATRAVAYSLDVTFYRPGVYGPSQKAVELLHAQVERADAFDPAWDELVEGLMTMAARHAPGTAVPDRDAWAAALRRARYRER